jgi:hypothetical protein
MNARQQQLAYATAIAMALSITTAASASDFEIQAGWNDQLFPSFIVATATIKLPQEAVEEYEGTELGDPQGLLGITIEAPEDETEITVTVTCDEIMEESVFTGTLASGGETYTILPKIKWNYKALMKQRQAVPITVTFTVEVGDEDEVEQSRTLTLRSVNDCPFTIVENGEARDVSFMFAAYVNEQHPFVDKLLREALNAGIVESFTGYQSQDPVEVYRQVYAIWHALSERDLRYSDITTTAAESDYVSSQHVRLLDESVNNGQANCVDGSVLLASMLRKVGIEPILVMVPGHCYLAFYLDAEAKQIAALETTLIGSAAEEATKIKGLKDAVSDEWKDENSWKTFTAAIAMGVADLEKNGEQFKSDEDPDYQLIPVIAARKIGILPIAFQSNAKLAAPVSE